MALTKKVYISDFTTHPDAGTVTLEEQVEIIEDGVSLGRLRRSYRKISADYDDVSGYVGEDVEQGIPATVYNKGDMVTAGNSIWICNRDNITVSPLEMTAQEWTELPKKSVTQKLSEVTKKALSEVTHQALEDGTLSVEDANEAIALYPAWKVGLKVDTGSVITFQGTPYKCVQGHVVQADWRPNVTPALWTEVAMPGVIADWVQPTDAQDAYNIGDQVNYQGSVYESTIDANTWSPTEYPAGWTLIT